MACFLVPLAEAAVVTAAKAALCGRRRVDALIREGRDGSAVAGIREKLGWLQKMLYGGSALLAIEHVYHGEVTLLPPFLAALRDPEDIPVMLHEMATAGVGMALCVTAAWGIMAGVSGLLGRARGGAAPLAAGAA